MPRKIHLELAAAVENKSDPVSWINSDVRADLLLRFLAARFPEICRDFLREPLPAEAFADADIDMGAEIGLAAGAAVLKLRGRSIALDGDRHRDFESESVIVAEVLMSLGDALAEDAAVLGLSDEDLERWIAAKAKVDLLPFPFGWSADEAQIRSESAFYARRLGHDLDAYRRAACWLRARQVMHAVKQTPEPGPSEWNAAILPPELPDATVVRNLVETAAVLVQETPDGFEMDAVGERNADAHQAVFYRGWTREPRSRQTR